MSRKSIQNNASFTETLTRLIEKSRGLNQADDQGTLPSWTDTALLLEDLRILLLMTRTAEDTERVLAGAMQALKAQLEICTPANVNPEWAESLADDFLAQLPLIKQALLEDTETALQSDPAVKSREEIVLCYPGLRALVYYRVARVLYSLNVPLLPRLMTEIAHSITGIDIHPGAEIGQRFFIDHGTGVVIGATCIIGDDVKIYQGVTLGALSFPRSDEGHIIKGLNRHPVIGDRVTIYSGATILGRIQIGSDSVIGGNVWVTRDVAAMSHVMQRRPRHESFMQGDGI